MSSNLPFEIAEGYYTPKEKPKSEKEYILLISFNDGTDDRTFIRVTGQEEAREYLKDNIGEFDINESFVLVEDVAFRDGMPTVYEFLKLIEGNYHDGFDPDQYLLHKIDDDDDEKRLLNHGDAEQETFQRQQSDDMLLNGNRIKEIL